MPGNTPRPDLNCKSSVKIVDLDLGPSMRMRLPSSAMESEARLSACDMACDAERLCRSDPDPDPIVWVFFIEQAREKAWS
jgi:hypothetical protein